MTRETTIIAGLFILFAAAFGVMVYMAGGSGAATPAKVVDMTTLVAANSHTEGSVTAKVKIVEFGDFQCPACGQAYPILKQVMASYATNTDVALVFRHFPLPQHQNARIAAEAVEAAGAQDKFWPMFDQLYTHQAEWAEVADPLPKFKEFATTIGLELPTFEKALKEHTYAKLVDDDAQAAAGLALNHTPTIFINSNEVLNADINVASLKAKIDAELAK
jgi:protein-disulfide isomerase